MNPGEEDIFFAAVGPPALSRLRVSPRAFRPASVGGSTAVRSGKGTTVRYRDSMTALTTFTVQRSVRGYRVGRRCASRRPRHAHGARRCLVVITSGRFTRQDKAGRNTFHFTGRVSNHKLPKGTDTLRAIPALAGRLGAELTTRFTIKG